MLPEIELEYVTVCTVYRDASEEELSNLIEKSQNVSKPKSLPQVDIYIETDNLEDYTVIFSDGKPEPPDYPMVRTVVQSNIIDNDTFHVHSYFEPRYKEVVLDKHEQLWGSKDEVELSVLGSTFSMDAELNDVLPTIGLDRKEETIYSYDSLEFSDETFGYYISEDPEQLIVSVQDSPRDEISPSNIHMTVEDQIETSKEKIEEVLL